MPKVKIRRSLTTATSIDSVTDLTDGELFFDKSTHTLYVGSDDTNSGGTPTRVKIQKAITVSPTAPTSNTSGNVGDIWLWYQE